MAKGSAPQRFGKCLVEREIGRGARSVVYLAWHEGLQIPVAVKVLQRSKAEDDELFSCSIYETRPFICRNFAPGSSDLCPQYDFDQHPMVKQRRKSG